MFILGLGTAAPHRYTQTQCWEALRTATQFQRLDRLARTILEKVLLTDNGIRTRSLVFDALDEAFAIDPDTLHRRFLQHAPILAVRAAAHALAQAGLHPEEIDAVIVSTCTGYLCPGLSGYVAETLGLKASVFALDLVGQGCAAALPNLRTADALISARDSQRVLSICVEICSAAFYLDNDPGVLVSACLFSDGAGAAVLADAPSATGRRIEWKASGSIVDPSERDALRFEHKGGMLRNILTPQVPALAARYAASVLDQVLHNSEIPRSAITTWIWHAGGRKVLDALQERMGLTAENVGWSRQVLSDYGNLSSPFVYFVLQSALEGRAPDGGWWLSSFGAGFSCHGALLQVG